MDKGYLANLNHINKYWSKKSWKSLKEKLQSLPVEIVA
jgi:hypothetical protein